METLGLSPSTPKPRARWLESFWPVIDSGVPARTAAQNAMYACFVIGGQPLHVYASRPGARRIPSVHIPN